MKKIVVFVLFSIWSSLIFAQQGYSLVEAFQRNYTRGSLVTKIEVLQDSVNYPDEDMSPLFLQSLDFVTRNASQLSNDNLSRELTALTVRLIGIYHVELASSSLWNLFGVYNDLSVRVEVLSTLGETAGNDLQIIDTLNRWVDGRNNLFRAGQDVELELLGEALTSLGKLGQESSFTVIFASAMLDYPESIRLKAEEALRQVKGDYRRMVTVILRGSPLKEKLQVLRFVVKEPDIPGTDKSWIARTALEITQELNAQNRVEQEMLFQLQEAAVGILLSEPSPEAVEYLIRHFDNALLAWERELVANSYLIQAINALGVTGTHEAAERLTLYLELLNLYTENGQPVESEIVSAVIRNIGTLGDRVAFDYLLYVRYLNYPDEIKRAAREALDKLKRM